MAEDGSDLASGPSGRRDHLIFLVYVYRKLTRPLEDCFRGRYTSLQLWTILILDAGGPMSISGLAAAMRLPKQQMSRMVESLVEEGILFRKEDPQDRRRLLIGLSDQAGREMETGWLEFERRAERLLSVLSEAERRDFDEALDTLSRLLVKLPKTFLERLEPVRLNEAHEESRLGNPAGGSDI